MKPWARAIFLTIMLAASLVEAAATNSKPRTISSSYAPRTHSGSNVYGSPIAHPLVSRSHAGAVHHRPSSSSHRATGVARDSHGRIKRSAKAQGDFRHGHPCPATGKTHGACPGYVIDHVRALEHGGADKPSNMQWQTKAAAKAKDKIE